MERSRLRVRITFCAAALAPLIFVLIPISALDNGPDLCLLKRLMGASACWGCGITRGVHSLLRGDWQAAWNYNVLSFLVGPLLGWEWLALLRRTGHR